MKKEPIKSRGWILMVFCWATMFIAYIGVLGIGMVLPDIRADFGMTLEQGGYLSTIAFGTQVILAIPVALFATRINPKYVLGAVFVCTGSGFLLHGVANTPVVLYIGRGLVSIGYGLVAAPMALLKTSWVPNSRIATINGYDQFAGQLGQIVGTMAVTGIVAILGSYRVFMNILGVAGMVIAVLWFVFYRENEENPIQLATGVGFIEPLKEALREKSVWLLALGWPGTTLVWIAFTTFWPTYASETLGLSMAEAGIAIGMIPIFSAIACVTSPQLANLIGRDKLMIWPWGIILCAAYYGGVVFNNFYLLCVCFAIAGYGAFAFVPIAMSIIFKLGTLSPSGITLGMAVIMMLVNVGGALAGVVVGKLSSFMELREALSWCCLTPLLWFAMTIFLPELGRKRQEELAAGNK